MKILKELRNTIDINADYSKKGNKNYKEEPRVKQKMYLLRQKLNLKI